MYRMTSALAVALLLLASTGAVFAIGTVSLGDTVWVNTDGDAEKDAGEAGIPGATLALEYLDTANNVWVAAGTTTTDGSGLYKFTALQPNNDYRVTVTLPGAYAHYVQNYDRDGVLDCTTHGVVSVNDWTYDFGFVPPPLGSVGDRVWYDANSDTAQDDLTTEYGLNGWTVILRSSTGVQIATDTTSTRDIDGNSTDGGYLFTDLPAGTYTVEVVPGSGYTQTYDLDGLGTPHTATFTLGWGDNRRDVDFGYVKISPPSVTLVKDVDLTLIEPGDAVVYSYTVTNTGGVTLTNVVVKDDNGTPLDTGDDFIAGTVASLAPGEQAVFSVTKYLTVNLEAVTTTGTIDAGSLTSEVLANGDVKVTFIEGRNLNDNTYGTTAVGWPNGHKFSDLLNSDKAEFRFTDTTGKVVLDFYCDYVTASTAFPSGYGCLGPTGGDGSMVTGSVANVASWTTSLAQNLNQSPAYYGYTVNSPVEPNANWDYKIMYQVVVKAAAFGTAGFGGVTIPLVHNSPSKNGQNAVTPNPKETEVINTAVVTAVADGQTLTASDTASVVIKVSSGTSTATKYTTYTQGEWGGTSTVGTAGALMDANFATVYPSGLVVGGGYTVTLSTAAAVDAMLPAGGGPAVLDKNYVNPTTTKGGELAGNTVALKLNVDFSAASITKNGLGGLHLKSGKLVGRTVNEVLALANAVLGGDKSGLVGLTIKDLNTIIKTINLNYEKGTADKGYLIP